MRVVIGGDHAGYTLKGIIVAALTEWGHEVEDVGSHGPEAVDFPDIAREIGAAVVSGRAERGVMVCGTGIGAAIAANKLPGIRAALCHDVHSAHQSVEHDDANVLCLGAKIVGEWLALDLVRIYLDARFSGDAAFRRRLEKVAVMEQEQNDRRGPSLLSLSAARQAELAPKLAALVADLQRLDELVTPETEPIFAGPWDGMDEERANDAR